MLQPLITATVLRRVLNIIREKKRPWVPRSFDIILYRGYNHRRGLNSKLVAVDVERLELLMASQLSEPWNRRVEVRGSNWGREHAVDKFGSLTPCFGIDGVKVENCRIVVGKGGEKKINVNVQATASVTPLIR